MIEVCIYRTRWAACSSEDMQHLVSIVLPKQPAVLIARLLSTRFAASLPIDMAWLLTLGTLASAGHEAEAEGLRLLSATSESRRAPRYLASRTGM